MYTKTYNPINYILKLTRKGLIKIIYFNGEMKRLQYLR